MKIYKRILDFLSIVCIGVYVWIDNSIPLIFLLLTASMKLGVMIAEEIQKRENRNAV